MVHQSQPGGTETDCQMGGGGEIAEQLLSSQPLPLLPHSLGTALTGVFSYGLDLGGHLALSLPLVGYHPSYLELTENCSSPSPLSPVC